MGMAGTTAVVVCILGVLGAAVTVAGIVAAARVMLAQIGQAPQRHER